MAFSGLVSNQELASINGAEYIKSIDKLPLQVCVRKGNQICIHPDQIKQWNNSGLEIADAFAELKKNHDAKYMNMLASLISEPDAVVAAAPTAEEGAISAGKEDDPVDLGDDSFESIEKLQEVDPVLHRCVSEIQGIELLKCKSGKVFLLSDKSRVLAKHSLLGGYGTGKLLCLDIEFFDAENLFDIMSSRHP